MTGGLVAALHAVQRMSRDMDRLDRELREMRRFGSISRKGTLAAYNDPAGRFVFRYPPRWELRAGEGVQVVSALLGSFARVDVFPAGADPWEEFQREIAAAGGKMEIASLRPERARGDVRIDRKHFAWDGFAYVVKEERVVLSLGNVIDPRRSALKERSEDRILSSIRRNFTAGTP